MAIPKEIIDTIISTSKIEEVISDFVTLKKKGNNLVGNCPKCGGDDKLSVNPNKKIFKCFVCDFKGNSAVNYLMEQEDKSYPEALKYLADKYHIIIDEGVKGPQRKKKEKFETFRDKQLKLSGLTDEDQKAYVYIDKDTQNQKDIFIAGTLDQYGQIVPGDDMIIYYYDLEGKPVTYQKPKSNKFEHLYRVRWQVPQLHKDKDGRPVKYKSPYGSGSHLYIPEIVRRAYKDARVIKRLYIQEGEKKSEKACKHGMFSVGVMGIHNIGDKGELPYELQLLIQRCKIEEVVFVMDSDWDQLSEVLTINHPVDMRPRTFFRAVANYRNYLKQLTSIGIYLELYFAHINENEKHDKGIDDLLANTLKDNEKNILTDIEKAIVDKAGKGEYMTFYKVSTMPDLKLRELWHIEKIEDFFDRHRDRLMELSEFLFNRHKWRYDAVSGKPIPSQPLSDDEIFWSKYTKTNAKGEEYHTYQFDYENAYNFLRNRGFGRIMMASGNYQFCNIEKNRVVTINEAYQIKDFVIELARTIGDDTCPKEIRNMLFRGGKMYFGPDSLGNMDFVNPQFEKADKSSQNFYFSDKYWSITASGIEEKPLNNLPNYVWSDRIIRSEAKLLEKPLVEIKKVTQEVIDKEIKDPAIKEFWINHKGSFSFKLTPEGEKCHFLKFLMNTSEFYWKKFLDEDTRKPLSKDERTPEERYEKNLHILAKMTSIGYLLHKYRDKSCEKAIIAMDGRNSEVGESNGRSGKSLVGQALRRIVPVTIIPGKSKDLTEDKFIFEEVSEKTDIIFIDDVRANVDFEFFFPLITGQLTINAKSEKKYTIPESDVPKLYITTNHSINGESGSFLDRQFIICFSDYYDENHKPINEFGINFFDDWDLDQYNLFYNLMATCLQLYFTYGLIPAPLERIESRRLRQFIGEEFLAWANEYFSISDDLDGDQADPTNQNINARIPRKEMWDNLTEKNPNQKKFTTPHRFKKKILAYCRYKKLQFNPACFDKNNESGADDKSGGVEYFTIANKDYRI